MQAREQSDFGKVEYESLRDWILQLPTVTQAPHSFGGIEFQVQGLQFMHFHGFSHLDIRLSKLDQARMLEEEKVEPHLYAPEAGWVTLRIHSAREIERVKELVVLAYNNARHIMAQRATRNSDRH